MQAKPKPVKAWPDSTGVLHTSIEDWQKAELKLLFTPAEGLELTPDICVDWVLNNRDNVVELLTSGPRSRPGARKKAGTTQPKRAARRAAPATAEQAQAGFAEMRAATEQVA